jgi:hypothetical protein
MQCANQFCKMQLQNAENGTVLEEFVAAVDLVMGDKPNHPGAQYHRPLLIGTNVLVVGGPKLWSAALHWEFSRQGLPDW